MNLSSTLVNQVDDRRIRRNTQGVNVIGAEGVDILSETPCVWPLKRSAQGVLKWEIVQIYAKPKLQKYFHQFPTGLMLLLPMYCTSTVARNSTGTVA